MAEGEFSHEQLLEALDREVKERKLRSRERNELTFMKNSAGYLEDRSFQAWLESSDSESLDYTFPRFNQSLI